MDIEPDNTLSLEEFHTRLRSMSFKAWRGRIELCRSFIQNLQEADALDDLSKKERNTALAFAYLRLAEEYERRGAIDKTTEALNTAGKHADLSTDKETIYEVLTYGGACLSRLYLCFREWTGVGVWEQAVAWKQRSLRYVQPHPFRAYRKRIMLLNG